MDANNDFKEILLGAQFMSENFAMFQDTFALKFERSLFFRVNRNYSSIEKSLTTY